MIGEKLGKYTVLEVVGKGSMGTVYKAEDPDGQLVAIKLVRSQILYSMELRERFLQGALIASEIRHAGICPVLEVGDDNDDFFVIMPFIEGRTLEQYMNGKPLPCHRALDIAVGIGSALEAIHKAGAVHRGLKPANIWILNGKHLNVQISDCCIGRCTEIAGHNRVRFFGLGIGFADTPIPPGTLAYMSPEQVRGEHVDYRTDVFSFGVVLYEMLSGRHPFEARNSLSRINAILEAEPPLPISKQAAIPPQLELVVLRALAKNREERYQSIKEMLVEVNRARESAAAPPDRMDMPVGIRKWFLSRLRHHISK
jgi:serine/threonine protein kinase